MKGPSKPESNIFHQLTASVPIFIFVCTGKKLSHHNTCQTKQQNKFKEATKQEKFCCPRCYKITIEGGDIEKLHGDIYTVRQWPKVWTRGQRWNSTLKDSQNGDKMLQLMTAHTARSLLLTYPVKRRRQKKLVTTATEGGII